MLVAEALQERAKTDAGSEPLARSLAPPPPGHFVSSRHESDCARFVSDAKRLALVRAQGLALGYPSSAR